jgi:hypothetical protein
MRNLLWRRKHFVVDSVRYQVLFDGKVRESYLVSWHLIGPNIVIEYRNFGDHSRKVIEDIKYSVLVVKRYRFVGVEDEDLFHFVKVEGSQRVHKPLQNACNLLLISRLYFFKHSTISLF